VKLCENAIARLLVHLYKACIEAVRRAISVYSETLDATLVKKTSSDLLNLKTA